MKQKLNRWAQRYLAALRKHLSSGSRVLPLRGAALRLGREAVDLGLESLELARIHGRALTTLKISGRQPEQSTRAELFFRTANAPIEAMHRAARQNTTALRRLQVKSGRPVELAASHRQMPPGAEFRQESKPALGKSRKAPGGGLPESLRLQNLLRQLTHRVLAAQEEERTKLSQELQNEIAQTLVGIQVRLLALKQEARGHTKELKNQIASAQQLVVKSAKSVRQFARKLNSQHQASKDRVLAAL